MTAQLAKITSRPLLDRLLKKEGNFQFDSNVPAGIPDSNILEAAEVIEIYDIGKIVGYNAQTRYAAPSILHSSMNAKMNAKIVVLNE